MSSDALQILYVKTDLAPLIALAALFVKNYTCRHGEKLTGPRRVAMKKRMPTDFDPRAQRKKRRTAEAGYACPARCRAISYNRIDAAQLTLMEDIAPPIGIFTVESQISQ